MNFLTQCPHCFSEMNSAGNCMNSICPGRTPYPGNPIVPDVPYPTWPNVPSEPNMGWICPNCGTGLSPTTTKCDCNRSWTTTGIGINLNDV
jgi:hypothetical protein